jgi:hypothetical protein
MLALFRDDTWAVRIKNMRLTSVRAIEGWNVEFASDVTPTLVKLGRKLLFPFG